MSTCAPLSLPPLASRRRSSTEPVWSPGAIDFFRSATMPSNPSLHPRWKTGRAVVPARRAGCTSRDPRDLRAREFVTAGGLMSYGTNLADAFKIGLMSV